MITKEIKDLLNHQINMEFYSAYLYLDMANFYDEQGLDGYATWFTVQAQEEQAHAMLFRTYCLNNDIPVEFEAIEKPHLIYKKFKDPLIGSLEHEMEITASIYNIYDVAKKAGDYRTIQLLDWFVAEQAEEELNATDNIRKFDLFGDDAKGLFMLDQQMGTRVFVAPVITF